MRGSGGVRVKTALCVRLLCRILCRFFFGRFCRLFVAPNGRLQMFVSCHQIVPQGHTGRVAQPACDHLYRLGFDQFRFAARPPVLKQLRPRLQASVLARQLSNACRRAVGRASLVQSQYDDRSVSSPFFLWRPAFGCRSGLHGRCQRQERFFRYCSAGVVDGRRSQGRIGCS